MKRNITNIKLTNNRLYYGGYGLFSTDIPTEGVVIPDYLYSNSSIKPGTLCTLGIVDDNIKCIDVTTGTSSFGYDTIFAGTSNGCMVIDEKRGDENNSNIRNYSTNNYTGPVSPYRLLAGTTNKCSAIVAEDINNTINSGRLVVATNDNIQDGAITVINLDYNVQMEYYTTQDATRGEKLKSNNINSILVY